jgi:hypothetical protein
MALLGLVAAATAQKAGAVLARMAEQAVGPDYTVWGERIESLLGDGPRTAAEIRAALAPTDARVAAGIKYVVGWLAGAHRIVRSGVAPGWRNDQYRYVRWADWLPGIDPRAIEPADARAELVRVYARSHGPMHVEDVRWWSGMTITQARAAVAAAGLVDAGDGLLDTPDAPPRPPRPRGTRLLPVWDGALMGHADRSRILAAEHRPLVFDRDGNATLTVAIDGRITGVWTDAVEGDCLAIVAAPFASWTAAQWRAVEAEASLVAAAMGMANLRFVRADRVPVIRDGPRNQFLSPLRDSVRSARRRP